MSAHPYQSRPNAGTRAKGNSGGPMVLIAYGAHNVAALRRSCIAGALVMTMATQVAA